MRRIKIALLVVVGSIVLAGCPSPAPPPAPAPAPKNTINLLLDSELGEPRLNPQKGDVLKWYSGYPAMPMAVHFPLTSPCKGGANDVAECEISKDKGSFPYVCGSLTNNSCPDPEVVVGTEGENLPPFRAAKDGRTRTNNVKVYLECVDGNLKLFDPAVTVTRDNFVIWKASGDTPVPEWTVVPQSGVCSSTDPINQSNRSCLVAGTVGTTYTYTATAPSCSTTPSAMGSITVR